MLKYADYKEINLLRRRGNSIRRIKETTGYSRSTIRKVLREKTPPPIKPRKRTSKLDDYKTYIQKRYEAEKIPATELSKEIEVMGYDGSARTVQRFLAQIRNLENQEKIIGLGEKKIIKLSNESITELSKGRVKELSREEITELRNTWMLKLLQGKIKDNKLGDILSDKLNLQDIHTLLQCILNKPLRYRNRAMAVLAYSNNISKSAIARFLFLTPKTISRYIKQFESGGVERLLDLSRNKIKKSEDPRYKDTFFSILHSPPSEYDINRTTWKIDDLHRIMAEKGFGISRTGIRKIIKNAGYSSKKAKTVLTSNDPDYREKLEKIINILSNLGPKEKFFSIDEYGPFSIRIHGGRSLVPPGQRKTIPKWQRSKGSLIMTGALELSTNQVTHFYSEKKNTKEMIKLLDILLEKYSDEECIYLSWDAASWHASNELEERVEEVNSPEYRAKHKGPRVELAPLPSCAQFLNVIESIFSGMARAIIHNSDYESVEESMKAIDRYFAERNRKFKETPKRAGKKIWGKEQVKPQFSESNNCKDPRYR